MGAALGLPPRGRHRHRRHHRQRVACADRESESPARRPAGPRRNCRRAGRADPGFTAIGQGSTTCRSSACLASAKEHGSSSEASCADAGSPRFSSTSLSLGSERSPARGRSFSSLLPVGRRHSPAPRRRRRNERATPDVRRHGRSRQRRRRDRATWCGSRCPTRSRPLGWRWIGHPRKRIWQIGRRIQRRAPGERDGNGKRRGLAAA
jgi:hypothetical protein